MVKNEPPNCVTPLHKLCALPSQLSFHQTETSKLYNDPKRTLRLEDLKKNKHKKQTQNTHMRKKEFTGHTRY